MSDALEHEVPEVVDADCERVFAHETSRVLYLPSGIVTPKNPRLIRFVIVGINAI